MALTSPNGQLFVAIQERLVEQVAALKWIDQNFNQLEIEPRPPVNFPCALIDLVAFIFEDLSNGSQRASGRVIITIATAPFSNSNMVTPTPQKEKALEYYEIEYAVHVALHNWQPLPGMETLTRRTMDKVEGDITLRERMIVFECGYTDTGAVPATTQIARPEPIIGSDMLLPT